MRRRAFFVFFGFVAVGVAAACSSSDDAPASPGDAGAEASARPHPTSSGTGTGDDLDAAKPSCTPSPPASVPIPPIPTTAAYPGLCTDAQIAAAYSLCLTGYVDCAAFVADAGACGTCLVSNLADGRATPFLKGFANKNIGDFDYGGCWSLVTGDATPGGCADKIEKSYVCGVQACASSYCTTHYPAFTDCFRAAEQDPASCAADRAAAKTCIDGAPAAARCFAADLNADKPEDTKANAVFYGQLFCGSAPDAGGVGAGGDGGDGGG